MECIRRRRNYTREAGRTQGQDVEHLWVSYKEAKKTLRNKIKSAKKSAGLKGLCDDLNRDIWGDGYKIAMKSLLGFPVRPQLSMEMVENVAKHLFPEHPPVIFACDRSVMFTPFSLDELKTAGSKLKNKKAPGPGGVPPEIIKRIVVDRPQYVLDVYNQLASNGHFPYEWKRANLMLLKKGNKTAEDPSSYRPICLLDVEGKLYEQLILIRLNRELERTGGLSDRQFGFREKRQTMGAILEVTTEAEKAAAYTASHRRLCAVITLDVKNAFNSASWQIILNELRNRGVNEGLINIIRSYLSEREIILEAEGSTKVKRISSGVPQGSVLGPTLWNVMYDSLLEIEQPDGVKLIGFADDVAMVAVARTERSLMDIANTALLRVAKWMKTRHLKLAAEKTEVVLLTTKRKLEPITFNIQGTMVGPTKAVKYLGVWLDVKLTFAEHVEQTIQKAERTITALMHVMPNTGGPRSSKRRVLAGVVHSQLLYAAPVWQTAVNNGKLLRRLNKLQRKICIRICSGYRSMSLVAAEVIAGIPPLKLLVLERSARYAGTPKGDARASLLTCWQEEWTSQTAGRWTRRLIPNIRTWFDRSHGEVDYFLCQALSGHGCFRKYLFDKHRADSDQCTYCGQIDDAEHTLFVCQRWTNERAFFYRHTGQLFTAGSMMNTLLDSEMGWQHAYDAVRKIIEVKEREAI